MHDRYEGGREAGWGTGSAKNFYVRGGIAVHILFPPFQVLRLPTSATACPRRRPFRNVRSNYFLSSHPFKGDIKEHLDNLEIV